MHSAARPGYWLSGNLFDQGDNRPAYFRVADTTEGPRQCHTIGSGKDTFQGGYLAIHLRFRLVRRLIR
jgi:hypothetical protein